MVSSVHFALVRWLYEFVTFFFSLNAIYILLSINYVSIHVSVFRPIYNFTFFDHCSKNSCKMYLIHFLRGENESHSLYTIRDMNNI